MKINKIFIMLIVGLFIVSVLINFLTSNQSQQLKNKVETLERITGKKIPISIDDDPILGDKNAPVTIIEFSDFDCPFCKEFFSQHLPRLNEEYIKTGKVRFVYRDAPLEIHEPNATRKAIAANCAREQKGDQGYFQFHNELFLQFNINRNLLDQHLAEIAKKLDLNLSQFITCQESQKYLAEVEKDKGESILHGNSGTPTFYIGKTTSDGIIQSQKIVGFQTFGVFRALIDESLKD